MATLPAGDDARAQALRLLPDELDRLLRAQVAARRAAVTSWEQIGRELALHPDAARRRYSPDRRPVAEDRAVAITPHQALEGDEPGQEKPVRESAAAGADSVPGPDQDGTDHDSDVLLAALADAFGRNIPMRDAFLADQSPAMRTQYWSEMAEAKARIHRRSRFTPRQALKADKPPTVPAETIGQADAAPAPVDQPPTAAAKPRRAKHTASAPAAPAAAAAVPWYSDSDPVKRRRWYTDEELNTVQVVKTDRGDGAYWVIIAGDLLGTVEPHRTARGGRSGWEARHRSGSPAWHLGGGVKSSSRPATRAAAVIDLIADVQHAWTTHRERRKREERSPR